MKKLLVVVAAVVLVLVLVGFLLPGRYEVERSRVLDASPAEVFALVADLETWPEWTAWSREADPECEWTFESLDAQGRARRMTWSGPAHGDGELDLVAVEEPSRVDFALTFVSGDTRMRSDGTLALAAQGDGTRVDWSMSGELAANPAHRWVGLFMDSLVGRDFERGLDGLERALGKDAR